VSNPIFTVNTKVGVYANTNDDIGLSMPRAPINTTISKIKWLMDWSPPYFYSLQPFATLSIRSRRLRANKVCNVTAVPIECATIMLDRPTTLQGWQMFSNILVFTFMSVEYRHEVIYYSHVMISFPSCFRALTMTRKIERDDLEAFREIFDLVGPLGL